MGRPAEDGADLGAAGTGEWTAIRSPVAWALLGLVIERPGYGYGLVKRFEREYAELLAIKSDWHIYRALDGLKRKGLIEEVTGQSTAESLAERQPKPHYQATESGVKRYSDWLIAQIGGPRRQSQLFARQLAVLAERPKIALAIVERYEEMCLREAGGDLGSAPDTPRGSESARLTARLTSEEGRLSLAATLPWLQFARSELESLVTRSVETDDRP
jgi:DNA-binding PadR family transcriptional regulator